jgi:hypothetical protein
MVGFEEYWFEKKTPRYQEESRGAEVFIVVFSK